MDLVPFTQIQYLLACMHPPVIRVAHMWPSKPMRQQLSWHYLMLTAKYSAMHTTSCADVCAVDGVNVSQ